MVSPSVHEGALTTAPCGWSVSRVGRRVLKVVPVAILYVRNLRRCASKGGIALFLASAIGLTLQSPGVAVAATPPLLGAAAVTGETPFAQAKRLGTQVEITNARTEYNTSFADPAGTTTVRMSTVPVRAKQGSAWVPIDPTLGRRADGLIAPKASTIDVAFSSGGTGPLVTFRRGSEVLQIGAPMNLPPPVLTGPSATYAEVLPGVDLVVTATGNSFSEVFVVKNAAAATNDKLRSLQFAMSDRGLDVRKTPSGGIEVLDASGASLSVAQQPTMWDSSSKTGDGARAASAAEPSGGQETSVAGPVEGDRRSPILVSATETSMTLTPDLSLLTGANTTFPVYIDPSRVATRLQWGMVDQAFPTTSYYQWGSGDSSATEGMGYYSNGGHTKRLFYGFDTAFLRTSGTVVVSSTLRAHETWAYTCITVGLQAWLTTGISSATTWNNQPEWIGPSTARSVPTSGRPECQPSGSEIDFNVTAQVAESVRRNYTRTTIGLRASSETSSNGWRRFTKVATLEVVYNAYPNVPTEVVMTSPATACGGTVPSGDMPIMEVRVSDRLGDQVRAHFELFRAGSTVVLSPQYYSSWGGSGVKAAQQMPALADGSYTWRARTQDNQSPQLSSTWTPLCAFTVDGTPPVKPVATFVSGTFAVGQSASFQFSGGGTGVASYRWSVNSDAPTSAALTPAQAGSVAIPLTTFGPFTLRVWAYDAAGNRGAAQTFGGQDFLVAGADALDWWRMNEASGTTSANQRRAPNQLTLAGGIGRVPGRPFATGNALLLDGTGYGSGLAAGGPANGQNFSASAWGKLTTTTGRQVLISQDVGTNAGFTLAVETVAGPPGPDGVTGPSLPRLTAILHTAAGGVAMKVVSSRPVQEGEWTHAAIAVQTLETGARQLALYTTVDGDSQVTEDAVASTSTTPAHVVSTASTSYIRVGTERKNSLLTGNWTGSVDEVVTAQGIFDETQRSDWRRRDETTP